MATEREAFDERRDEDRSSQMLLAAETLRNAAHRHIHRTDKPKGEDGGGISMFWRVFGGTIFSIVALVIITAYTTMTGNLSDLRKDLTQVQADQLKKDDFKSSLSTLWSTIKELQTASSNQAALNEHFKLADEQMDKQAQSRDEARKEFQRKTEEQRKASADERKDLQRRIEELCQKVQSQAERIAALEGRQSSGNVPTGKTLLPNRKNKPGTE
jgi:hypothetical protein